MVSTALTDRSYRPSSGASSLAPRAEALYAAFASCPTPTEIAACPHCVSDDDIARLARPVPELPVALVSRFCRKAGTTWGGPEDLRRVTPRLLVLAADHRLLVSRELLWQKLRWAGWTSWPADQTDAVGRFLLAEFERLLSSRARPAHVAHRWLAQISAGIDDVSGFLTVWHDTIGPLPDPSIQETAVDHLVELLANSPLRPDLPATIGDVFPRNAGVAQQVTEFLVSPATEHHLRRAATEHARTPSGRRIGVALERLRRFSAAVGRGDRPEPDADPLAT